MVEISASLDAAIGLRNPMQRDVCLQAGLHFQKAFWLLEVPKDSAPGRAGSEGRAERFLKMPLPKLHALEGLANTLQEPSQDWPHTEKRYQKTAPESSPKLSQMELRNSSALSEPALSSSIFTASSVAFKAKSADSFSAAVLPVR